MKLTTLSVLTALALTATSVSALTLYQDPTTGQVFTKGGEGRVEMGDFVDATTVYSENDAQDIKIDKVAAQASAPSKGNGITIMDQNSPEFLLGKQTHINMKFVPEDNPDMWLKAGVRIQGTFENERKTYRTLNANGSVNPKEDSNLNDAYLRRVRFEIAAGFGPMTSFVMDIRNDKANYGIDNEEEQFNVGDAYVKIKKPFGTSLVNFKLYRAKIDISRTETVKSARVISYDRPYVADYAAQFISFNRRGTNVQMYGDWKKKIHYQIAMGDATADDKQKDALGIKGADTTDQSFFYGGKVILSPFDGWEEKKRTETYFAEGKHAEIGVGYWAVPQTKGKNTITGEEYDLNHRLLNIEASAHYKGFFVQAEYFKFNDVIENWNAPILRVGDSDGWYVTSEYVMKDFYYVAPFFRYESWDKFSDGNDHEIKSKLAGVNWYLRGNTTKVGLYWQRDDLDRFAGKDGLEKVERVRLTSQWFF